MDVVVGVLLFEVTSRGGAALDATLGTGVLVLRPHLVELGLVLGHHLLLVLSNDGRCYGVYMLGRQNLVILNRLHSVL